MVKAIIKEKEILIAQIDDLFSFDTNQVLNEIQQKLNDTKDAMQAYKDHLVSFILSNDIKKYFNEFALNKVVPLLAAFQVEINKATKDKIILNIEKNSANITKLNSSKFITESNKNSEYFKNDYFLSINSSIESYGTTDYENLKNWGTVHCCLDPIDLEYGDYSIITDTSYGGLYWTVESDLPEDVKHPELVKTEN
jgi:hypothetical protein